MATRKSEEVIDIPSHIMRERRTSTNRKEQYRYTLTYNEGTKDYKPNHIAVVDIPSHIMREPRQFCIIDTLARYTLTYNEGTEKTLMG